MKWTCIHIPFINWWVLKLKLGKVGSSSCGLAEIPIRTSESMIKVCRLSRPSSKALCLGTEGQLRKWCALPPFPSRAVFFLPPRTGEEVSCESLSPAFRKHKEGQVTAPTNFQVFLGQIIWERNLLSGSIFWTLLPLIPPLLTIYLKLRNTWQRYYTVQFGERILINTNSICILRVYTFGLPLYPFT